MSRMTLDEINKRFTFPLEEQAEFFKKGELHPIYKKHLRLTFAIEQVYGAVEAELISLGKARELVAALVEYHTSEEGMLEQKKEITVKLETPNGSQFNTYSKKVED